MAAEERAAAEKKVAKKASNSFIRYVSRRGAYNMITFTDVDAMPSVLTETDVPDVPEKNCAITGKVAKYRDPLTGCCPAVIIVCLE